MFTKYGQTEKNFTLPKACKKIGEMNQDIEKIREGLNQEINATLTLEKHNALLLRQVDQLRHLFEHFSEEIMGNLDKSNRNMDEKFFELAKISEEKDLKFEKFAEFLKGHYEEIIGKVQKLQT